MARSKQVVGSLGEALAQAENYPKAIGFYVAALRYRGGGRAWLLVDPESGNWVKAAAELSAIPIDVEPSELPELPRSPLGEWALAFVDEHKEPIKPEILIIPQKPEKTSEPASRFNSLRNESLALANEHSRRSSEGMQSFASMAHASLTHAGRELEKMSVFYRTQLEAVYKAKLDDADRYRKENEELRLKLTEIEEAARQAAEQLAEKERASEWHQTLRVLFHEQPELLVNNVRDLLTALSRKYRQLDD